jgi:hypothetical protein
MELAVRQIAQKECCLDPTGTNGLVLVQDSWRMVKKSNPTRERKVRRCAFSHESKCRWRIECNRIFKMDETARDVLLDEEGYRVVDYCFIRVPKSEKHSNHKTSLRKTGLPLYFRKFLQLPSDTAETVRKRLLEESEEFDLTQLRAFVKHQKAKFKKRASCGSC